MTLAETMISGEWITAFVVAVIGAVASGLVAWKKGEAKGRGDKVTLQEPVPEIPVKRVFSPPTFYRHQELVRRVASLENETKEHREYVEGPLRDIRRENGEQFVKLMNAGEDRKDKIMDGFAKDMARIHERMNKIFDQLKK
jgi:hypothetical protein